jgi:hypothetical protein
LLVNEPLRGRQGLLGLSNEFGMGSILHGLRTI